MKEAKDSSLVDHTSTLLLSESIHTTPKWVSHPKQVMRGRRFLLMRIYSSVSFHHLWWIKQSRLLVHISFRSWTCRHGRKGYRERDQGQPKARASP